MASFFDDEVVIGQVQKTRFAHYVVSLAQRNGKWFLNVKEWYTTTYDDTPRPAKPGIMVPLEGGTAEQLEATIARAITTAKGNKIS